MGNTDTSQDGYLITTDYGRSPFNAYQVSNVAPQVWNQNRVNIGFLDNTILLTSALISGNAYTSLSVGAVTSTLIAGNIVQLVSGSNVQQAVLSAGAAINATTLTVTSFTANFAYPIGTQVSVFARAGVTEEEADGPIISTVAEEAPVEEEVPVTEEAPVEEPEVESNVSSDDASPVDPDAGVVVSPVPADDAEGEVSL